MHPNRFRLGLRPRPRWARGDIGRGKEGKAGKGIRIGTPDSNRISCFVGPISALEADAAMRYRNPRLTLTLTYTVSQKAKSLVFSKSSPKWTEISDSQVPVDVCNFMSRKVTPLGGSRTRCTYCQDQEIIYDFHAQLQGTGSGSEVFRYN